MAVAEGESPFDLYANALKQLDDASRGRLSQWSKDILLFAELTDGIVWDGLVTWLGNNWSQASDAVAAFRGIGASEVAADLDAALALVRVNPRADAATANTLALRNDAAAFNALVAAEAMIERDWALLWDMAEAYARSNGWSATATQA